MGARIRSFGVLAGLALALLAGALPARAEPPHAVVLMYHRFGETALPSTNIRLDQFEAHIAELQSGGYSVLPLSAVVDAIMNGQPLPDRSVAITIDDAYASVHREAWPRLKAAGFPFTVFVSTDQVGRSSNYMTWAQIRELDEAGVEIGHHGAAHAHMSAASIEANAADIERADQQYLLHLGRIPQIFAYPYGEANLALRDHLISNGFKAAFGQHSGVAVAGPDFFYLPRFALNQAYGGIERFRLAVNALPIAVAEIAPADMTLRQNPPSFGFTLTETVPGIGRLNCFASHLEHPVRIERLGPSRFEVRFEKPFPPGRSRVNCTMRTKDGRWRWLGRQFYVPKK